VRASLIIVIGIKLLKEYDVIVTDNWVKAIISFGHISCSQISLSVFLTICCSMTSDLYIYILILMTSVDCIMQFVFRYITSHSIVSFTEVKQVDLGCYITWMGDRQERRSAVNLCPFVGVDLNL